MGTPRKIVVSALVLVALVVVIGAAVTGVQYSKTVLKARESVLTDNLTRLRKVLKEYALKESAPPKTLDDLVKAGYLREIPDDPITGNKDWQVINGESGGASNRVRGIVDVHSASANVSSQGTPYNEW